MDAAVILTIFGTIYGVMAFFVGFIVGGAYYAEKQTKGE